MIVLDTEWIGGYYKGDLNEIIQIAAVRMDDLRGPITDTFNVYMHPRFHKRLSRIAKSLPEIDTSLSSPLTFPEGMELFRAWCGKETVFGTWGREDIPVIQENCAKHKLPLLHVEQIMDLQRQFGIAVGAGAGQIALIRAVEYLEMPAIFDFHQALNDAMYTALVTQCLTAEDMAAELPPKKKRQPPQRKKHRTSKAAKAAKTAAKADKSAAAPAAAKEDKPAKKRRRRYRRRRTAAKKAEGKTNAV